MRTALFVLLTLVVPATTVASDFFTVWPGHKDAPEIPGPPDTPIDREWLIGLNMRGIAANNAAVSEIAVRLPDRERIFAMRSFSDIAGFEPVGDDDFQIIPGIADEEISYNWYGEAGTEQMTIAVYQGVMSATITGGAEVFSLSRREGQPVLRDIDVSRIPNGHLPQEPEEEKAVSWSLPLAPFAKSSLDVVDVLVVHTPDALALTDIGGDMAVLNSRVAEAFLQTDTAMTNSGMTTVKMRNVLSGGDLSIEVPYNEVPGNTCVGTNVDFCRWIGHRIWARTNLGALRDAYNADLVVMLVEDHVWAAGISYVQSSNCGSQAGYESTPGCGVGAAYADFAFAVVDVAEATAYQVFTHETGHQFGMQHQAGAGLAYFWSLAKTRSNNASETVVGAARLPRNLQYSNPNVFFIGTSESSGASNRFNALTGACLAPVISGFRTPGQVFTLFWDGFESPLVPLTGC